MQPGKTQSIFIPAPFGGMNREVLPINLPPNEAYKIKNYQCGIASLKSMSVENGASFSGVSTGAGFDGVHSFVNSSCEGRLILTSNSKVMESTTITSGSDITGAVTITDGTTQAAPFNDYLFIVNGTDDVIRVPLSGNATQPGFVGPGGDDKLLSCVWGYRGRIFFIGKDSTSFWYHKTIGAVSGTLTEVDLNNFLNKSGKLLAGATWSTNTGAISDELNVIISDAGEVLIYSGSYPDAADWYLVSRTFIPKPVGNRCVLALGADLMIITQSGVISLQQALPSGSSPADYYRVSQKVEGLFTLGTVPSYAHAVRHSSEPFFYFLTTGPTISTVEGDNVILVLNSRTGAWSYFQPSVSPTSLVFFGGLLVYVTGAADLIYSVSPSGINDSRSFESGWLSLGTEQNKRILRVRLVLGSKSPLGEGASTESVTYTCNIRRAFNNAASPGVDSNSQSVTGTVNLQANAVDEIEVLEFLNCGIVGQFFKFTFSGTSLPDILEEVHGFYVDYEVGGGLIAQ